MLLTRFFYAVLISFVFFGFSGCDNGDDGSLFTVKTVELTDLQNEYVYFIFTNPSPVEKAPVAPSVTYNRQDGRFIESGFQQISTLIRTAALPDSGGIIDIQLWQIAEGLQPSVENFSRAAGVSFAYEPPSENVGTAATFRGVSSIDDVLDIRATCREKISYDGNTLVIYVADDCWTDGGSKANLVDGDMVTALVDRFLKSGGENDIWDWVSDIYGEPWGTPSHSYLIEPGAEDYITILLYDIAGDNSTDGGIVGFFNPENNYIKNNSNNSNERLMFAMDAVLYATKSDDSWDDTDYWPQSVFSTLAHEFQHMVHYYQKQIVSSAGITDTWLNEMCSLVTEDLLADKIVVPGPRGVNPPTDGSAALSDNCSSTRISTYNYWSDDSLTTWGSEPEDQLISYATAYSFGAFLARNYGGAALFRNIVQNNLTDERAITEAIAVLGYGDKTFGNLLSEWAVAVLDSDSVNSTGPTFNTGNFYTSSPFDSDGTGYNLGSVNFYNYYAEDGTSVGSYMGLIPFGDENGTFSPVVLGEIPPASNVIFLAGSNLNGDASWDVEIPRGMTLKVFRK